MPSKKLLLVVVVLLLVLCFGLVGMGAYILLATDSDIKVKVVGLVFMITLPPLMGLLVRLVLRLLPPEERTGE